MSLTCKKPHYDAIFLLITQVIWMYEVLFDKYMKYVIIRYQCVFYRLISIVKDQYTCVGESLN